MKTEIRNRKGQKISLLYDAAPEARSIAFIQHGYSGFKEQPHIAAMAEVFVAHGISAIRFDTTNSFGESDGNLEFSCMTLHAEDLEDVIAWASTQEWYAEPFYLAGHSMGGGANLIYASRHPEKVKAMAPTSSGISGKLLEEAYDKYMPEVYAAWKRQGFVMKESGRVPGVKAKAGWIYWEDLNKYDLLVEAATLTMPALLVVGSEDKITLPEHQRLLFDALQGPKEYHVIEGSEHTFKKPEHIEELREIFDNWLKKVAA